MSLINDALKEAKAQSAHGSLPPDLVEKIQASGTSPEQKPEQGNGGDNSSNQTKAPKKRRKGGAGELAIFAIIFFLLVGGLLTAGYFLFPDLARKAGLEKATEDTTQPASEQTPDTTTNADTPAEPAIGPKPNRESQTKTETEKAASVIPDPKTESDPAPETTTASDDSSRAVSEGSATNNDTDAVTEPQPVETAAEVPESVEEATPETSKPQPAPAEMRREFHLSAIVGTASRRMAVINGGIVQAGDTVSDITILSISRRQVIVEKGGSQFILRTSTAQ